MGRKVFKNFLILTLILVGSFVVASFSHASAAEYYVAGDTGLDTNAGTSSLPWKTIQKAADVMVAGDIVNVKGGVVYNTVTPQCSNIGGTWESSVVCIKLNSGTASNRITYRAWANTGQPIIDASNAGRGITIMSRNYISINGFLIINAGNNVTENNEAAIWMMGGNYNVLGNNKISGLYEYGIIIFYGGNNTFEKNIIEDAEGFALTVFTSHNSLVSNNVINRSDTCINNLYSGNVTYVNNILNDCYTQGFKSQGTSTSLANTLVINNIISNSGEALAKTPGGFPAIVANNNLMWNNTSNYSETGLESPDDIHADPLFVDVTNDDFRLQPNSPAINEGANVAAYGITTDILGRARPNAGAYDIGAYEDPNIYVAGDVASSGNGSMQSPYKTLQEAADVTTPGDIVNAKGGITYDTIGRDTCNSTGYTSILCTINSGQPGNYITYRNWPNTGRPLIDKNTACDGISTGTASYIIISGFKVTSSILTGCTPGAIDLTGASNIIVHNNIIYNNTYGIDLMFTGAVTPNIFIINNTIHKATSSSIRATAFSNPSSIVIQNNIISGNQSISEGAITSIINMGSTMTINNNILYGNGLNYTNNTARVNDLFINPLFIDVANNNFRLHPDSPAIDAGVDTSAYGVIDDVIGVTRPVGTGYDIGAYEFYSIPVSITSPTTAYVTTTSPTITGTATTTASGAITSVEYSLDNGPWTNATGNFSFTLNDLTQGSHTVRVRATDSYGNQTHESEYAAKTFTVDSITPTILLTKLGKISDLPDKVELTYYFTSQTPKIEGVTEANSTVTFKIGLNTYTTTANNDGNFIITLDEPKLVRGENDITYFSTDLAGNISETRTLKLVVGEEYFPAWIYEKIVIEGQDIDEVDQDGDSEEEPTIPAETYKILFKDENGNPLEDTKVEIDGRFYTTDADGFIYITDIEMGEISYTVNGEKGTLNFNPDTAVNEVILKVTEDNKEPDNDPTDKETTNFNWWWLIVPFIIFSAYIGYTSLIKKSAR